MNSKAYILPVELWQHIFSFACLDDGSTAPFKYRSIAITGTHWSQIITFSQFFCKLPASQKKTVSLFVHHPYPFLDIDGYSSLTTGTDQTSEQSQSEDDFESSEELEDIQEIRDGSTLPECNDGDDLLDVEGLFAGDRTSDVEGGSDDTWDYSDGVWDSEFEGSFDSEEDREILEDVEYLEAVRNGWLPPDGNTRDDISRDADIQAFFDNVLQAFRAFLNEISPTLQILSVYWTSFKPLQIHELLPPLPCLVELHLNRSSIVGRDIYEEPPTTVPFPHLMSLYISGDNPRKLSFSDDLARIAPNLAYLRFSMNHFYPIPGDPEGPKHNFYFHTGCIIIEVYNRLSYNCTIAVKRLRNEFGVFQHMVNPHLAIAHKYDSPEIWQKWWTSQMIGIDDDDIGGPWRTWDIDVTE